MAAYELFAATTTDLMIQNIKNKAEAYGWTIDFFGIYSSHNRLHLHNAYGAHFEIWWSSTSVANIKACTGYDSGAIPTAQPGVSETCQFISNLQHLIVITTHTVFVKIFGTASGYINFQFGYINDKIGSWSGGICISSTSITGLPAYSSRLWYGYYVHWSQVFINGAWSFRLSALGGSNTVGGGVNGICESELYSKMPLAYSGGILPVPILLVQIDPTTTSYLHPIGYAPDARCFNGGNVYVQLEEIIINGEKWLALNQEEAGGTFLTSPNLLLRLAV